MKVLPNVPQGSRILALCGLISSVDGWLMLGTMNLKLLEKLKTSVGFEFLKSFEDLLEEMKERLLSLQGLLELLGTLGPRLLGQFEYLLKKYKERLAGFEDLIKKNQPAGEKEKKELLDSFSGLLSGFQGLVKGIQGLKERLGPGKVPPHIQNSDIRLAKGAQELGVSLLELLFPESLSAKKSLSSERAEEFVDRVIDNEKIAFSLGRILIGEKPLTRGVLKGFEGLVAGQEKMLRSTAGLVKRVRGPSGSLLEGVEDLEWVHGKLVKEAKQLKQG